jgi:hypothetical protein
MHSHDFKRGSGGFIHGFRYLIKYFVQLHYTNKYDITTLNNRDELVKHFITRINTSSALYQMYGQMCDIFYYNKTSDSFVYYNSMTKFSFTSDLFPQGNIYFTIQLEYGNPVTNIMQIGEGLGENIENGKEIFSLLLHPVIRVFDAEKMFIDEIHFVEDLFTKFTDTLAYHDKFLRTIKMFL